ISYQDKRVLISQGVLGDTENFSLKTTNSYLRKLKPPDKETILNFASTAKRMKGEDLVKKTYIDYPYFAIKSKIAKEILNRSQLQKVKNSVTLSDEQTLFTIGYEGLTIDAYINKLILNNVSLVIDVRKNPLSMKYGFSKTKMKTYLEKAGIKYEHIPELGIDSKMRKELKTPDDYKKLFKYYKKALLPKRRDSIKKVIEFFNQYNRIALTCFEAEHESCHRHKITQWLMQNSFKTPINHI
ncbi:MAG: DUF488 domain-containing protein, partial [Ignavibacteriae bacterium]